MGIVSHCPNGHRIKVKDYLAGKIGICPSCSARFRIPPANASPARVPDREAASGLRPESGVPVKSGLPVAAAVSLDEALPAPSPADSGDTMLVEISTDELMIPAAISEAAAASWCIAVPGGQPSAAMTGDALLDWLTSGRATGGELVWRSDWSDWRPVTEVFPDHVPPRFPPARPAW
jgi:hypothetical protein